MRVHKSFGNEFVVILTALVSETTWRFAAVVYFPRLTKFLREKALVNAIRALQQRKARFALREFINRFAR